MAATSAWIRPWDAASWAKGSTMRSLSSCREGEVRPPSRWPRSAIRSNHPNVLELPRVRLIQVLGEQFAALIQGIPIGVLAHHGPQVGQADFQRPLVVHVIGL